MARGGPVACAVWGEDGWGDRAMWSPGTRDFLQPHLQCPRGGWAWAPCTAGVVTGQPLVPGPLSVSLGGSGRTGLPPSVLPRHSWVVGGTFCCESTHGCPNTLLLLLHTPLLSIFTCVGPPRPGARHMAVGHPSPEPLGTVFPHRGDGDTLVGDAQWGSGQPHGTVAGEPTRPPSLLCPPLLRPHKPRWTPQRPQEPLVILISSSFYTIPTAPCLSVLPVPLG